LAKKKTFLGKRLAKKTIDFVKTFLTFSKKVGQKTKLLEKV
jgi:hypothetical protein